MKRDRWRLRQTFGCLLTLGASLGWPAVGRAAGTWTVLSLPRQPGEMLSPTALATDAAGNLYVADAGNGPQIQQRDAQGNWSVVAPRGASALAVDAAGNLYVAGGDIQKRDPQGNWSVAAPAGDALGQVDGPTALAADGAGNLYVADQVYGGRIQKRDVQGNWSVMATWGTDLGQVWTPTALAVDAAGSLYVAQDPHSSAVAAYYSHRIQKRDAQGSWSVVAATGSASGQVNTPSALAVDAAGSLYVADGNRIQKRDAQGNWSVVATTGSAPGQVNDPSGLAADTAGNAYVADRANSRIQERDAQGSWSVISLPQQPGEVLSPAALATDPAGNLYVADYAVWDPNRGGLLGARVQKRDARGNWSVVASEGTALGQVTAPIALAVDIAGNLYVDDGSGRIQKRDAQGNWTVIDTAGDDLGQVGGATALTVDTAGDLFVAGPSLSWYRSYGWIQERDAQGNWSAIADGGAALGQVSWPFAFAVDKADNLYVADFEDDPDTGQPLSRIQERDAHGNWSVVAMPPQVVEPTAVAVDSTSNLYLANFDAGGEDTGIQKLDAHGNWSVMASYGSAVGQVSLEEGSGLGVDGAGHLYVADTDNNRVLEYTPEGGL